MNIIKTPMGIPMTARNINFSRKMLISFILVPCLGLEKRSEVFPNHDL
jgi:hypothetical protein